MKKVLGLALLLTCIHIANAQVKIYVHLDTSIKTSFTGRLILLTQNDTTKFIGQDPSPQASFAMNLTNWQSGQVQVFDNNAEASGLKMQELKPGYYRLAAVMHIDSDMRTNTRNPGNAYTRGEIIFYIPENKTAERHLYLNTVFTERAFRETGTTKLLNLRSAMLSSFHKKEVAVKATVILPDSINTGKKYPVVFIIPGWGGTHYDALGQQQRQRYGIGKGKEKIYVYLNPETQTRWGLHAFVDSRVNGPWGKSLVEEVIPYLKQQYPVADNYFVVGQSSGGYGAAWLQLNYPDVFNGCWAVSPDPVDFSDYTGINLYTDKNAYTDAGGKERGLFLDKGIPTSSVRNMTMGDDFNGDGGQQQSFEAEFGKLDADGKPKKLFDRKTGVIDRNVMNEWQPYDLGKYIQQNWSSLSRKLSGKVHIYAGAEDNFYLDRAVTALAQKAKSVNTDVVAELIPGANHWTIWSAEFTNRVQREIDARIP